MSVAISTLDRPDALARCLDGILSGDVLPDEIVIVDQSYDRKSQIVVEQRRASGVPIIYVQQQRRGLSASRNSAIAHSNHPFIAITDDDCVPDRRWVSTVKNTFLLPSPPDAITGRILPLGEARPGLYDISSRVSAVRTEFRGKVVPWVVGSGGNFALNREWFDRIGGYDERLGAGSPGMAAEDADFFYRLLRAGAHIRYEPEGVIYHERQNISRRLATRWSYGYGIGAFCGMWLRQRDLFSVRALAGWLAYQGWCLISAIGRRQWMQAYQLSLSLRGTVRGLVYGVMAR